MTLQALIARALMDMASSLAPASRTEWTSAMHEEFAALQGGPGSLGWASGCLGTAIGWRVRTEAGFGATLVASSLIAWLISVQIFFFLVDWTTSRGLSWMPMMSAVQVVLMGGLCFAMAFSWPQRALLTGLFVPLTWSLGSLPLTWSWVLEAVLRDPWGMTNPNPFLPAMPVILMPFQVLAQDMGPSLIGAALGWNLAKLWRTHRGMRIVS